MIETIHLAPGFSYNHRKHFATYGLKTPFSTRPVVSALIWIFVAGNIVCAVKLFGWMD